MKKILFAAMAAMVLFASCDKNDVNDLNTSATKKVYLKLQKASDTRAVADVVSDFTVEFYSGYMYFVTQTGDITKHFTLSDGVTSATNLRIADLEAGIENVVVPSNSHYVYVIANLPAGVTLPTPPAGNYSSVENVVITAASQAGTITSGGAIKGVMLYSDDPGVIAPLTHGGEDWAVKVEPKQIANRLELTDIKAKTNSGLDGFKVEGIYVNYFYQEKKIGDDATPLIDYEDDPSKYAAGQGLYTISGNIFYDEPGEQSDMSLTVAAGPNKVWGYNLLAGAKTPHIVIKLSNIQVSDGFDAPSFITDSNSIAFVTVKGFKDDNGEIDFSYGGRVFTVSAGDLEFELKDITERPEIKDIKVQVKVHVTNWESVLVKPVI